MKRLKVEQGVRLATEIMTFCLIAYTLDAVTGKAISRYLRTRLAQAANLGVRSEIIPSNADISAMHSEVRQFLSEPLE